MGGHRHYYLNPQGTIRRYTPPLINKYGQENLRYGWQRLRHPWSSESKERGGWEAESCCPAIYMRELVHSFFKQNSRKVARVLGAISKEDENGTLPVGLWGHCTETVHKNPDYKNSLNCENGTNEGLTAQALGKHRWTRLMGNRMQRYAKMRTRQFLHQCWQSINGFKLEGRLQRRICVDLLSPWWPYRGHAKHAPTRSWGVNGKGASTESFQSGRSWRKEGGGWW